MKDVKKNKGKAYSNADAQEEERASAVPVFEECYDEGLYEDFYYTASAIEIEKSNIDGGAEYSQEDVVDVSPEYDYSEKDVSTQEHEKSIDNSPEVSGKVKAPQYVHVSSRDKEGDGEGEREEEVVDSPEVEEYTEHVYGPAHPTATYHSDTGYDVLIDSTAYATGEDSDLITKDYDDELTSVHEYDENEAEEVLRYKIERANRTILFDIDMADLRKGVLKMLLVFLLSLPLLLIPVIGLLYFVFVPYAAGYIGGKKVPKRYCLVAGFLAGFIWSFTVLVVLYIAITYIVRMNFVIERIGVTMIFVIFILTMVICAIGSWHGAYYIQEHTDEEHEHQIETFVRKHIEKKTM